MIEIVDNTGNLDANDRNHSAYLRGVEHYKATNFYLAAQSFSEALGYWLEDPQAWFALGNCYDEMGKPKKAERCFRTALLHSGQKACISAFRTSHKNTAEQDGGGNGG